MASYPEEYAEKKSNPRFETEKSFISQVIAEIGSQKEQIIKNDIHIFWQDKPRPRIYWYSTENTQEIKEKQELKEETDAAEMDVAFSQSTVSEHDLYPILITYI